MTEQQTSERSTDFFSSAAIQSKKDLLNYYEQESFQPSRPCCSGASDTQESSEAVIFRFQSGPQLILEIFYKTFTIGRTLTYRKDLYHMKNSKQTKTPIIFFMRVIIFLALVILALGGLTLYSFQDLACSPFKSHWISRIQYRKFLIHQQN